MDPSTTEIYTLSLHDALPISDHVESTGRLVARSGLKATDDVNPKSWDHAAQLLGTLPVTHLLRSEEHTSELQSHSDLVCRLLLEKKNKHKERDQLSKQSEDAA